MSNETEVHDEETIPEAEVICAGCGYPLPEREAEPTKTGPMHWGCASRHYPDTDHVFPY